MQIKHLITFITLLSLFTLSISSCEHSIPQLPTDPATGNSNTATCNPDTIYFEQSILPMVVSNCAKTGCHNSISLEQGYDLTTYEGIMKIVIPGDINSSTLYTNTLYGFMPLGIQKLTPSQIYIIKKWITQGAKNNSCNSGCEAPVVTYFGTVKPAITAQCQGCHSGFNASGGIDLSNYTVVKAIADNGSLWGAIHKDAGYKPMPPIGPGLSSCQVGQFKKWINAGAPNN